MLYYSNLCVHRWYRDHFIVRFKELEFENHDKTRIKSETLPVV